jgi:hypothetical protein
MFLLTDHKYRNNIKDFFVGRVERDIAPPIPLSKEFYDMVSQYEGIIFDFQSGKQKFLGFRVTDN